MKEHRVRTAKAVDGKDQDHLFIEVAKDKFYEVTGPADHDKLHELLDYMKDTGVKPIAFNERAFHIGIIKDWKEESAIR